MHELSLMKDIIDIVRESAAEAGLARVTKVRLVVGELSNVVPEALEFAFSCLSGPPLFAADPVLEIEKKEALVRCGLCGTVQGLGLLEGRGLQCGKCGGECELVAGDELYVDSIEGE